MAPDGTTNDGVGPGCTGVGIGNVGTLGAEGAKGAEGAEGAKGAAGALDSGRTFTSRSASNTRPSAILNCTTTRTLQKCGNAVHGRMTV